MSARPAKSSLSSAVPYSRRSGLLITHSLPVDSRPEPEVSPEKNRTPSSKPRSWKGLYELSCYPWPAQVERHHVYGGRLSFTGQSQQLSVLLHQARRRSLHTYSCLQMSSFLSCSGPLATFFQ